MSLQLSVLVTNAIPAPTKNKPHNRVSNKCSTKQPNTHADKENEKIIRANSQAGVHLIQNIRRWTGRWTARSHESSSQAPTLMANPLFEQGRKDHKLKKTWINKLKKCRNLRRDRQRCKVRLPVQVQRQHVQLMHQDGS